MTNIKQLSNEELIALTKNSSKNKAAKKATNLSSDKSNVKEFLKDLGIFDGNIRVPNYLVYFYYVNKWKVTGKKLSKIGFLRKISSIFKSKRTGTIRYYMLNGSINLELCEEAKKWDISRSEIVKKNKKRSGEVSGAKERVTCEN